MSRVEEIIAGVIDSEGGYVDHPADRGGPTMYGITEAVARDAGWRGPMDQMPRYIAEQVYREQYVTGPGFGKVVSLDYAIGSELVDTGVNMGPSTAATFLQRSLNGLNAEARLYPDIPVDGHCGPQTRGALRSYLSARGHAGTVVMLRALDSLQGARYIEIAEASPSQEAFLFGWFRHRVGSHAAA